MRNRGVPISLFSFQDIITSLTGVMIIGILVIALQLVDSIRKKQATPPLDPEFEEMQRELAELRRQLQMYSETEMEEPDERLEEFRNQSLEQLNLRLEQERQLVEKRRETVDNLRNNAEAMNEETKRLAEEEAERHQKNRAELEQVLEEIRSKMAELKTEEEKTLARSRQLTEERNQIQDAIAQKQRKLEFAFIGNRTHTPILVECTRQGFRAAIYPPDKAEILDFQGKDFHSNLRDLTHWLKQFDFSRYYPVLLYRDGSLENSEEIEGEIKKLSPAIKLGRDPVSMSVEIFPK